MTDPQPRRRALLLGCGTFVDRSLVALRSPGKDVYELTRALGNPRTSRYDVTAEVDCTSRQAQRAIEGFFDSARSSDGVNLLYFSCHGVQDAQGRLYFAFADTERDYLGSTAVSAGWVRDRIYASRSKATVVLIDCCFSGAFIKGMRTRSVGSAGVESLVRGLPEGSGVAILTASGETEVSFEDADSVEVRPSYFTEALVAGIVSGGADLNRDGRVTVDELYDYVYDKIVSGPSPQRPRRLGMGEGMLVVSDAAPRLPASDRAPSAAGPRFPSAGPAPPPGWTATPRPPGAHPHPPTPIDPAVDHRRGLRDGAQAATRLPAAALVSLAEHHFDAVGWLGRRRDQAGLPHLVPYLGSYAASAGSSIFTPPPAYLSGFSEGVRRAWVGAVTAGLMPADRPTLDRWTARPPGRIKLPVSLADATIEDLRAARRRARRAGVRRWVGRGFLWAAIAFLLLMEIAAIATTIDGDWAEPDGGGAAGAVTIHLCFLLPLAGLAAVAVFDVRRLRRGRREG